MVFSSKTEAYSYALLILKRLSLSNDNPVIEQCISNVKIAIENHLQTPQVVAAYLDDVILIIPNDTLNYQWFVEVKNAITSSDYQQSIEQKFENPLSRRLESEFAISLFLNPTTAIMESVRRVSQELLKLMDNMGEDLNDNYLMRFGDDTQAIAFGLTKFPSVEKINFILTENNPKQLAEILFIHFKFAQIITRKYPIHYAPQRDPVGKLADIVAKIWKGTAKSFFSKAIARELAGNKFREYIANTAMYESPLYTALYDRGRKGNLKDDRTGQMGLMLQHQTDFIIDLPVHHSSWIADCQCQEANLNSAYVTDLANNDAVYVSGPSGMTGVFLGQMEFMVNFESEDLKKNYLSAIMAYLVSGGFHSMHEVLGPAQFVLNLVPGYKVQVPVQGQLADPPNYNQYFVQQNSIDSEFELRHDQAWENYLNFFTEHYVPSYIEISISEFSISQIRTEIQDYIMARGTEQGELNFISNVFRNTDLTKKKLNIASQLNRNLLLVQTAQEIEVLLENAQKANLKAEELAGKTYEFVTESNLTKLLERFISTIKKITHRDIPHVFLRN